jgi:hypothetical protein
MQFSRTPFWIQVLHFPLVCMTLVGTKIEESMGELEDVDVVSDGIRWGWCLRIRVVIDTKKPLEHGRALHVQDKSFWITFKYEKLPMFCFNCG